jgi:hypothetical protein
MKHQAQPGRPQESSASKWVVLEEWTGGSGLKETEKFTTKTPSWRVSWKTLTGDPDPIGSISITVRTGEGQLVTLANNLGQKFTSGNFNVLSKPGEHFLQIDSADRNWHVAVEYTA